MSEFHLVKIELEDKLQKLYSFSDGSGDEDGVFVDIETDNEKLIKENLTLINVTSDESFIDIDDPTPTNAIVDTDITKTTESSIDIESDHEKTIEKEANSSSSSVDIDISKHPSIIESANTTVSQKTSTMTNKPLTKDSNTEIVTKTTPFSNPLDTDDEDIAQGLVLSLDF